jgi:DDB1- and CUL4-associated factor 11
VQVLDRSLAWPMPEDPSAPEPRPLTRHTVRGRPRSSGCVRDVSWHSGAPAMMSVAWESDRENGSVALHEWKGYGKNAMTLEDVVEQERLANLEQPPGYLDLA